MLNRSSRQCYRSVDLQNPEISRAKRLRYGHCVVYKGAAMTQFHQLTMTNAQGEEINFQDFAGQTCLIVNVASR
jgi:hypothetical protein